MPMPLKLLYASDQEPKATVASSTVTMFVYLMAMFKPIVRTVPHDSGAKTETATKACGGIVRVGLSHFEQ